MRVEGDLITGRPVVEGMLAVPWLYDLQAAAALLPMTRKQLAHFLTRHRAEFPPAYWKRNDRRWVRVLIAPEIRAIRRRYLKGDPNQIERLLRPLED